MMMVGSEETDLKHRLCASGKSLQPGRAVAILGSGCSFSMGNIVWGGSVVMVKKRCKQIVRHIACCCLAFALLANYAFGKQWNVLFIAVDDLNDWIGCLGGHPQTETPHLDRLARSGLVFTNAHCAAPACNPSRAALMTGISPARSGMYVNAQRWKQNKLLANQATLPQHFKQNGYLALGAGKLYHGGQEHAASWHTFVEKTADRGPANPDRQLRPLNGIGRGTGHFDWGPVAASDDDMNDWQIAQWAASQVAKQHDKPFFVGCGIYRPHLPWYVPAKYFDGLSAEGMQLPTVLDDDLSDIPPAGVRMAAPDGDHRRVVEAGQWQNAVRSYLASIRFADACVGQVLDALDNGPNADSTIVILWSDHGWHLGEKQHWRKFALWEEATQVVMMTRVPGVTRPGSQCDTAVSLLDIYPTLIDVCGLPPRDELDGHSLAPLLASQELDPLRCVVTTHMQGNHSVRDAHYRYIRYADGGEELYDHRTDPSEWKNVVNDAAYVEVKNRLAKQLPKTNAAYDPPRRN
jgi:arylsulfatase A-like enzyme